MADSYPSLGTNTTKWMRQPDWVTPLKRNMGMTKLLIQYPGTVPNIWNENTVVPRRYQFQFANDNKTDEKTLLDFFLGRQGQAKGFWMPSWQTQFLVTVNITNGSFNATVRNDNFYMIFGGYEYLMLQLSTGDIVVKKITVVEKIDDDEENITFDTAFDRNIATTDIALACLFLFCRLEDDSLAVSYITNTVSNTKFSILELVREYP